MAKMATLSSRFQQGDYPMVCARSGKPADKLVPVEAAGTAAWPWFLLPVSAVLWLLAQWGVYRKRLWGQLPFATGEVGGITATWDRDLDIVILNGVHPNFVQACRNHQHSAVEADR